MGKPNQHGKKALISATRRLHISTDPLVNERYVNKVKLIRSCYVLDTLIVFYMTEIKKKVLKRLLAAHGTKLGKRKVTSRLSIYRD